IEAQERGFREVGAGAGRAVHEHLLLGGLIMMPTSMKTQSLWDKIIRAIRNDPKKAAILTVLVAILVVVQVRLQMSRTDAASRATASLAPSPHNTGVSGSGGESGTGRPQDSAGALRAWMNAPATPIGRNLFAINLERFPQDQNRISITPNGSTGFW